MIHGKGAARLAIALALPLLVAALACRPVPPTPKEPAVAPTTAPAAKEAAAPKAPEQPAADPRQAAPKAATELLRRGRTRGEGGQADSR